MTIEQQVRLIVADLTSAAAGWVDRKDSVSELHEYREEAVAALMRLMEAPPKGERLMVTRAFLTDIFAELNIDCCYHNWDLIAFGTSGREIRFKGLPPHGDVVDWTAKDGRRGRREQQEECEEASK